MINMTDLSDEFASPAAPANSAASTVGIKVKAALSAVRAAMVASRQAEAERTVRRYLAGRDDAYLMRMGMSADEIRSVRDGTWQATRFPCTA
jgi:hypothetical protein